jgi:hypothetical protein
MRPGRPGGTRRHERQQQTINGAVTQHARESSSAVRHGMLSVDATFTLLKASPCPNHAGIPFFAP